MRAFLLVTSKSPTGSGKRHLQTPHPQGALSRRDPHGTKSRSRKAAPTTGSRGGALSRGASATPSPRTASAHPPPPVPASSLSWGPHTRPRPDPAPEHLPPPCGRCPRRHQAVTARGRGSVVPRQALRAPLHEPSPRYQLGLPSWLRPPACLLLPGQHHPECPRPCQAHRGPGPPRSPTPSPASHARPILGVLLPSRPSPGAKVEASSEGPPYPSFYPKAAWGTAMTTLLVHRPCSAVGLGSSLEASLGYERGRRRGPGVKGYSDDQVQTPPPPAARPRWVAEPLSLTFLICTVRQKTAPVPGEPHGTPSANTLRCPALQRRHPSQDPEQKPYWSS